MTALSDHLFWDVDRSGIDLERHAAWLAKRVLEYAAAGGIGRFWWGIAEKYLATDPFTVFRSLA
jgi:hypothetical protein